MGFLSKNPSKNKKVHKNYFDKQKKSSTYLKMFWKKQKKFKAIWAVLGNSETKIFSVGQPWWPTFFQESNAHSYMAQNHSHVGLKVLKKFDCEWWKVLKNFSSLTVFKKAIKQWKPHASPCRLCRIYIYQVFFV